MLLTLATSVGSPDAPDASTTPRARAFAHMPLGQLIHARTREHRVPHATTADGTSPRAGGPGNTGLPGFRITSQALIRESSHSQIVDGPEDQVNLHNRRVHQSIVDADLSTDDGRLAARARRAHRAERPDDHRATWSALT